VKQVPVALILLLFFSGCVSRSSDLQGVVENRYVGANLRLGRIELAQGAKYAFEKCRIVLYEPLDIPTGCEVTFRDCKVEIRAAIECAAASTLLLKASRVVLRSQIISAGNLVFSGSSIVIGQNVVERPRAEASLALCSGGCLTWMDAILDARGARNVVISSTGAELHLANMRVCTNAKLIEAKDTRLVMTGCDISGSVFEEDLLAQNGGDLQMSRVAFRECRETGVMQKPPLVELAGKYQPVRFMLVSVHNVRSACLARCTVSECFSFDSESYHLAIMGEEVSIYGCLFAGADNTALVLARGKRKVSFMENVIENACGTFAVTLDGQSIEATGNKFEGGETWFGMIRADGEKILFESNVVIAAKGLVIVDITCKEVLLVDNTFSNCVALLAPDPPLNAIVYLPECTKLRFEGNKFVSCRARSAVSASPECSPGDISTTNSFEKCSFSTLLVRYPEGK